MSIIESREFLNLRAQLQQIYGRGLAGRDYDVFVISRFDENDDTLRPYLSTSYSQHEDPSLYAAVIQQKKKGGVWGDADIQGGGHAEEKFIRSLNELGQMFGKPRLIEVYVSRIPCGDRSSPWRAHRPFEHVDMLWPEGCGPKLLIAMQATADINWELTYGEDYGAGGSQAKSDAQINLMIRQPNVRVRQWLG